MNEALPRRPSHPERSCWGCERNCAAAAMNCGEGATRKPHPSELFGDDWAEVLAFLQPEARAAAPAKDQPAAG